MKWILNNLIKITHRLLHQSNMMFRAQTGLMQIGRELTPQNFAQLPTSN